MGVIRLVEQTACEHDEFEGCVAFVCDHQSPHLWTEVTEGCFCPGGSSREVTVDIEAGVDAAWELGISISDVESKAIVDAALGGGR